MPVSSSLLALHITERERERGRERERERGREGEGEREGGREREREGGRERERGRGREGGRVTQGHGVGDRWGNVGKQGPAEQALSQTTQKH